MFILASLTVLTLIILLLARHSKKIFNPMQGMVTSMFFGMNIGLTAGVLLGVTLQGNLFLSTILSMAIGILAGSICGRYFGILSILEGIMSGLMGGMMGAMVGEMINQEQSMSLIRLFLLISITTIFLFFLLPHKKNQKIENKIWLLKPIILAASIIFYFVGGVSFAEKQVSSISTTPSPSQDHNDHSNNVENKIENNSKVITIQAENMKYSLTEIVLKKNQPITVVLENMDNVEHDIEMKIPTLNSSSESTHNHGTEENLIHLHAEPNSSEQLTFTPVGTGVYKYICTIPGHKESGMVGQVLVN
ncbi:plastocyanin/azurin family copper-binding protein [Psychrobacillus psychrodurans]|uniref:plastocyanin/azurin family copper-binding protein n=1 Tax=Psychrobacillus TaxID=1221880 RepID=UPI001F4DD6F4|nr:plastocyanin/azurin family copper-binding protein [Psychrobacillus psychrodurans]MCK1998342.1 plastocyanin/azurin family copper-binding protein [Psychrobacillus psychrodurans]